jgi:hypothetical protein
MIEMRRNDEADDDDNRRYHGGAERVASVQPRSEKACAEDTCNLTGKDGGETGERCRWKPGIVIVLQVWTEGKRNAVEVENDESIAIVGQHSPSALVSVLIPERGLRGKRVRSTETGNQSCSPQSASADM